MLDNDAHAVLVATARTNIPSLRMLSTACNDLKVDLFTERYRPGTSMIEATCVVHDRYLLRMRIPVEVDRSKRLLNAYSDPAIIILEELEEVIATPGKISAQVTMKHGKTIELSKEEWLSIAKYGGKTGGGIDVFTNRPAAGIEILKQHIRETLSVP